MEASVVISLVALVVSGLSAYFSSRSSSASTSSAETARRAYRENFRPIVTARVRVNRSGNEATAFDLVIQNTGNRSAMEVGLTANEADLAAALTGGPNDALVQDVRRCFSTVIPVLAPGQFVSNSFGMLARPPQISTWQSHRTDLPIQVSYRDLEDQERVFGHEQTLTIGLEDAFAGGRWGLPD